MPLCGPCLQDNNIRYVALNTLARVVGVDTQAVQRHRATVVACVKDADVSIRRRALELVYALVSQDNIQALTTELLDYLKARRGPLSSGGASFAYSLVFVFYIEFMVSRARCSAAWPHDRYAAVHERQLHAYRSRI